MPAQEVTTMVEIAKLISPEMLIEIEADAYVGTGAVLIVTV